MQKFIYIFILSSGLIAANAQITISSSGGTWSPIISQDVILDAGDDYPTNYAVESNLDQTEIDISPLLPIALPLGLLSWNVTVSMTPIDWDLRLKLDVRRSGNGTGSNIGNVLTGILRPSISGGQTYQNITAVPTLFFSGQSKYVDIPIQYRISGMSVLIPTKTYTATVIYTYIGL